MANLITLIKGGFNTDGYYKSMNHALKKLDDDYTMLHYPYYVKDDDTFFGAQKNLTDYCISCLPDMKGKHVLEIGCGNGLQAIYMKEKYMPAYIKAIDINEANIEIARKEAHRREITGIDFEIGDAQKMSAVSDHSFDVVINIESAFHYPDKPAFLREIARVLKPGGHYLIADIVTDFKKGSVPKKKWKQGMQLNHWTIDSYKKELVNANLEIEQFNDITENVIRGFEQYPQWLKNIPTTNFIKKYLLKIFYTVNARLNIRLLKKQRDYIVISGRTAASRKKAV